jgi:hypothetical protein
MLAAARNLLLPVAAVIMLASARPAFSQAGHIYADTVYAWCANSRGGGMQYKNCGFRTLPDCLEEIRGLGGDCQPNPYYVRPPPYAPERHPHRARKHRHHPPH